MASKSLFELMTVGISTPSSFIKIFPLNLLAHVNDICVLYNLVNSLQSFSRACLCRVRRAFIKTLFHFKLSGTSGKSWPHKI
jgi:hypothetical protein